METPPVMARSRLLLGPRDRRVNRGDQPCLHAAMLYLITH